MEEQGAMTSVLSFENPSRRMDGHIGARATIALERADGWHQHYHFETHGMTSGQVADEIRRLEVYHAAKAERVERFRRLHGMVVTRGFTVVDCTILDRGVTLYVDVRPQAKGFPLRIAYHGIENVPTNDAILGMIAQALPDVSAIETAHAEFVAKVEARRA